MKVDNARQRRGRSGRPTDVQRHVVAVDTIDDHAFGRHAFGDWRGLGEGVEDPNEDFFFLCDVGQSVLQWRTGRHGRKRKRTVETKRREDRDHPWVGPRIGAECAIRVGETTAGHTVLLYRRETVTSDAAARETGYGM